MRRSNNTEILELADIADIDEMTVIPIELDKFWTSGAN